MNRCFRNYLAVSLLLMMSAPSYAREPSGGPEGTDLKVTVYVYNYAGVSAPVLAKAKQEVVRIYQAAGVEAKWVDCPCMPEEAANYPDCRPSQSKQDWVTIGIINRSMMGGLRRDASKFGLAALRQDGKAANKAVVCSECAEHLLEGKRYVYGTILGDLMAHEIGHLLLATPRHSAFGVMRAEWDQADFKEATRGLMFFTTKQAQRIQAQLRERMGHTTQMAQVRESQ